MYSDKVACRQDLTVLKKDLILKILSEAQILFGVQLGLDFTGCSPNVALAMIEDCIDTRFNAVSDLGVPSEKQIALASKFGRDISVLSKRVGSAVIEDIMQKLNEEAISQQSLSPGDSVYNKHDATRRTYVISSIKEDGTVYFRGGNGAKAWARSLVRIS